jgi:GNAT superfamily N-acetyltransferase
MPFSDLALSERLERAEGHACVQYAEAQHRLFPKSGAAWIECAGAYAVFNGVDSPITQSFGLGIFEELTSASLDVIERYLLCKRNYRPIELSNVLYRPVERLATEPQVDVRVRVTGPEEAQLWTDISARGWAHEHPELRETVLQLGTIISAREESPCFLAEVDGKPGAAGVLSIHDNVALFGGSATVPELRRRGLQTALLHERMRYAFEHGCDLAMMVAVPGSNSQRNAERKGFRIAYTRTKWQLCS